MRFINDTFPLIHNQRTAAYSTSFWSLESIIKEKAKECGFPNHHISLFPQSDVLAGKMIRCIFNNDNVVKKDNIFHVELENFICKNEVPHENDIGWHHNLLGFREMDHGLTFYGFVANAFDKYGVFMILYHDGCNLRLYTPILGNKVKVNANTEPLANDAYSEKYLEKQGLNRNDLGFNWNAIKLDILANIKVNYTNVMQSHLRTIEKEEV